MDLRVRLRPRHSCGALSRFWHKADLPKALSICPLSERSGHGPPYCPDYLRRFDPNRSLVGSSTELLREPNQHERKSNQKEEDAGLRRRLAISFSHCDQFTGSAQRSIGMEASAWDALPDRAELNSAIVRRRARVVPLRTVNEKLNVGLLAPPALARMRISASDCRTE